MPASRKRTNSNGKARMDAIALLKGDHRAVEALFESFESARTAKRKADIAKKICLELAVHAQIEEEIFYPAVAGEIDEAILNEAYVEHDGAKLLIAELTMGSPDEEFFEAKVKVLSEEIRHHVKEEEQRDGMFAQAKKAGVDLAALGEELAQRRAELKKQFQQTGIPTPETRSMKGARLKVSQPFRPGL